MANYSKFKAWRALLVAVLLGTGSLLYAQSVLLYMRFEAEGGTLSNASNVSDTTASGGAYLQIDGASSNTFSIAVSGNRFVNRQGQTVRLHGVNRSGTEYMCTGGGGPFDGPSDAASIDAMLAWHINAVRVPLNEHCWLGINGYPNASYSAAQYRQAIVNYVNLLVSKNIYPMLELHWANSGTSPASGQTPMPNRDHTPTFWTDVANTFKSNPAVMFDLYNEPLPDNNQNTTTAWTCWRDGGTCNGVPFTAAGMQELVTAVRNTGATNVIVLSGVQYSGTTFRINEFKPNDPLNQLAGSQHNYDTYGLCVTTSCWEASYSGVGNMPFIAGELGTNNCTGTYVTNFMNWADSKGASYLGWAWNTYDCSSFPSMISNYNGTPTTFGEAFRQHYLQVFP